MDNKINCSILYVIVYIIRTSVVWTESYNISAIALFDDLNYQRSIGHTLVIHKSLKSYQ